MSVKTDVFGKNLSKINEVLWANHIYDRSEIQWYTKFNRFGCLDPFNGVGKSREYLFFTKPDLHIVKPYTNELNPELSNQPYFNELIERYPDVIAQLQLSNGIGDQGPFMAILSNSVKNTLEIQGITSSVVDTPSTIYGTSYNYRGWGFSSDEKQEFSLEFEDTRFLEIYNLVKAYEEYERLKHLGLVSPPNIDNAPSVKINGRDVCFSYYIRNKILHDQFSVYKFIIDEDGETIMYYAKLWGVFFKNVPRDAFSDMNNDGGLKYALEFEAAFIDDLNPTILTDFNQIVSPYISGTKDMPIYNKNVKAIDGAWATIPVIAKVNKKDIRSIAWNAPKTMNHVYKLKWRV